MGISDTPYGIYLYAFTGSGFTPARRMAGGVQGYISFVKLARRTFQIFVEP